MINGRKIKANIKIINKKYTSALRVISNKFVWITRDMKIKNKLRVSFLLLSMIPIIITSMVLYSIFSKSVNMRIEKYSGYLMSQLGSNIYSELYKSVDKITILMTDDTINRDYHKFTELDGKSQYELILKINNNISRNLVISKDVRAAGYYSHWKALFLPVWNYSPSELDGGEPPEFASITNLVLNEPSIKNKVIEMEKSDKNIYINHVTVDGKNLGGIIIAKRNLYYSTQKSYGVFFTIIDERAFSENFKNIDLGKGASGIDSEIYIVNSEGIIQASRSKRMKPGQQIPDKDVMALINRHSQRDSFSEQSIATGIGKCLVSVSKIGNGELCDWYVVGAIPHSYLTKESQSIVLVLGIILLVCFIMALIFSFLIEKSISKPLYVLMKKMGEVEKGNLEVNLTIDRQDEIGKLQSSFNNMTCEINSLMKENNRANAKSRELELEMLEYQINPHFLYNTLDSINWMARMNHQKDISEMVTALAKFFRIGLSKGRKYIKVKEELEHVSNYLFISKIRFKGCFDYSINTSEEVLCHTTLKAVLQPVVENSIKHGLDMDLKTGFLVINCRKEDNILVFEVTDNGAGIVEERLQRIRTALENGIQDEESEGGFGLINIDQRIKLSFGSEYGVSINSMGYNKGTNVKIRFPIIE